MSELLFWIIVTIIILEFLFESILDILNIRNLKENLPVELKGIYDEAKYIRSQQYEKVTTVFSLISSSFSFLLLMAILFGNGFGLLDEFVSHLTENIYLRTLIFFGIIGLASDLLSLPFQLYNTFVIEEKFGFNKTTVLTFITDKLKSGLLTMVLGGGLLTFILWAWMSAGTWFVFIVFVCLSAFIVFMAIFYTRLIVPLFNKQTPLEPGELKNEINEFAEKAGFKLNNIFVINGSKRSTKANAYFSGLGTKKRIILYDTLINDLTKQEIVAVLAHEIGHYKKKHIYKTLALSLLQSVLLISLLSLALDRPELSTAIGAVEPNFYMGLVAFGILYSPVSFLINIYSNKLSRKYEYEADHFAAGYNLNNSLVNALIKLSVNNLSNLQPHPLYVFFHYSHPTLLQRKCALNQL